MHQSINIEKAVELVKNIVDSNRCAICDKSNGDRMRYPCGHSSCNNCVPATESCALCLTPQDSSSFAAPCLDTAFTKRSRNASNLLNVFQTEFNIDVYKRQRISEQLKVEKELFPQCIQAPAKYYNKRKCSKEFTEDKENNITIFPGEEVSLINKMENSNLNVRDWLNKCVKRKPLGDLNNARSLNTIHNQPHKILNTHNVNRSHRKRNHSEIWADENQTFIDATPSKKSNVDKTTTSSSMKTYSENKDKKNKDDSGISIDDEVIVIDDSQSVRVDKDMNAWLAVLEAEKHAQFTSTTLCSPDSKLCHKPVPQNKVPFYVRSPLSDNCIHCNFKPSEEIEKQPNVSITVENKSFTAIINVSKADKCIKLNAKQSVEVQTDLNIDHGFDERNESEMHEKDINAAFYPVPSSSRSKDMFLGEANMNPVNKSSNVIIAESESDDDLECSTSLQVTADVHRSCDEILVLGDIEDIQGHSKRARRAARGHTPTSTDSSDKENYNPNRKKKTNNSKKKPVKK